jgi:cyclic beta-1,2-glucan synthetase
VSDVYQDLFGSGIYAGKGIYEVETFHRSLGGRIQENAVLSHDLLEGAHGRAGLVSDIVLYETFPSGYLEHMRRWHRWVRGDWQLLPWLIGLWRSDTGNAEGRRLPVLERWKMLDNLRRSLLPAALIALVLAGWLVLPGSPWVWTVLTVLAPAAYLFTDTISGLARGRRRGAVRGVMRRTRDHAGRWLLALVFLVQDAAVAVDAVGRTLWRTCVSRRHLLEWRTAAHVAMQVGPMGDRAANWRQMWFSPAFAVLAGAAVAAFNPLAFAAALPLLIFWLLAPEIAAFISRPRMERTPPLDENARSYLRLLARRTWLYFETYAGPEDNWLPPDNVQEPPHAEIAHRTSPTNLGMMFLSSLTAWDLGYLGSNELAVRAMNALDTLDRLERHRGHMLNWYDTRTLEPLEPRYVSTVDSGNLAGCLIALREGCLEAAAKPLTGAGQWDGLLDELALLEEQVISIPDQGNGGLTSAITSMRARIAEASQGIDRLLLPTIRGLLEEELPRLGRALQDTYADLDLSQTEELREAHVWLERQRHHLSAWLRDLRRFHPWEETLGQAPPDAAPLAERIAATLSNASSGEECIHKCDEARDQLSACELDGEVDRWRQTMVDAIARGAEAQKETLDLLHQVAERASRAAWAMDFGFLFDPETRLFYIGYNLSADRIDPHRYDLLATEARLASFIAIAKGDVPVEHWFFLGRPVAATLGGPVLLSWNGSMFEYLMPTLLMRSDGGTLLGRSERSAVEAQRRHAESLGAPWGISESGFSARDPDQRYRYRAFGVPDLGLRRGLARDFVIAPYASALALAVSPQQALDNMRKLARLGALGRYGLREALDFTPERVDPGRRFTLVRSYMAHHQGMLLAALGNALCDNIHVRRFHAEPRMRSAELLLHERIPWEVTPESRPPVETEQLVRPRRKLPSLAAWEPTASDSGIQLHMLGNGRLASWISEAGGGGLWWHGHALTRWLPTERRMLTGTGSMCATRKAANSGRSGVSPPAWNPKNGEWPSIRIWRSFIASTMASPFTWRLPWPPATIWRSDASPSSTGPGGRGRSV